MSAAESARPGPDHGPMAAVIRIDDQARRPRRTHRSERTTVPPQPSGSITPDQRVASVLEAAYAQHRRSLTDESTALDFQIALREVRKVLLGALETGLLTEDEHLSLDSMFAAMERAPGVLSA